MTKTPKTTTISSTPYFKRPLAPASWPVLMGVCVLEVVFLGGASTIANDWIAVFACMAALILGAVLLDVNGRKRAVTHPDDLWSARLPQGSPVAKRLAILVTLVALVVIVTVQARPGAEPSPFPYFVAAGFLFLLLPQLLARRTASSSRQKAQKPPRTNK